jgi:hypothetical protein
MADALTIDSSIIVASLLNHEKDYINPFVCGMK